MEKNILTQQQQPSNWLEICALLLLLLLFFLFDVVAITNAYYLTIYTFEYVFIFRL